MRLSSAYVRFGSTPFWPLPGVEQALDVAALRFRELAPVEQAPGLGRVVVRDGGLEPLAQRDWLAQLPPKPAAEPDLRGAIRRTAQRRFRNIV
jgi:hypothetical protein